MRNCPISYDDDDDDDDVDDDGNKLFLRKVDLRKALGVFFLVEAIVRDSHHYKSAQHRKQDLNLCRTGFQTLLTIHLLVID